ncbi:MAG: diaminopimelate decarboxylase, partial [Acidiferrobacterales bacterium]
MDLFAYRDGQLLAEAVPLSMIAQKVGTPCYVYSRAMIERQWHAFDDAFAARDHLVCYAVKANSNVGILSLLTRLGSGFDIVSGGELERVLRAGGEPAKIVFSGVGKSDAEMRGALQVGVCCFNVESEGELIRLNEIAAKAGTHAPVALRVNPDVDPNTHPYIATGLKQNKFGIPVEAAADLYARGHGLSHVQMNGVGCHIGSQLLALEPFVDALDRVIALVDELRRRGLPVQHVDAGGGLGIRYRGERPPSAGDYVAAVTERLDAAAATRGLRVMIEPGRALVGEAGVLLTRVQYLKQGEAKNFAVVDAAINDLMRPALYNAWHEIVPVCPQTGREPQVYDIVGPVCESADFLGRDRELAVGAGELLAVRSAGAYGASMSSRYNTRALPAEVIVDGERIHVVRRRESI